MMNRTFKWVGVLACGLYLLNPTAGIFELIPDNLPFVGNLDEGAAGSFLILLLQSLRKTKKEEYDARETKREPTSGKEKSANLPET